MKKQKKFGRKLQLNKETIATLNQDKVRGGGPSDKICPCHTTFPTEVVCTAADCPTIHITLCQTDCYTCITYCDTCDC